MSRKYRRCFAEISLENIGHNADEVRKRIPESTKLLAVVKANAYGHGAAEVANYLAGRVDYYAVATLEEGLELREAGITHPILVLGYTSPEQYREAVLSGITLAVYHYEDAERLSACAVKLGRDAVIHAAVDTGMTRIGFRPGEQAADAAAKISALPGVVLEGLFTHFACADQMDQTETERQIGLFEDTRQRLLKKGVEIPICHVCNSAGAMELENPPYDMVRAGIVLYGIYPSEEVHKDRMDLRPALSWKTHVVQIQEVEAGTGISYGATYRTVNERTRVATLSAGYADGYPRALSSRGEVLIRGKRCPILGRVCMDQMMVDVTEVPDVQMEDIAVLIGRDGDEAISVEEVADPAGRFNYEMLCTISSRVERVYI